MDIAMYHADTKGGGVGAKYKKCSVAAVRVLIVHSIFK